MVKQLAVFGWGRGAIQVGTEDSELYDAHV